MIDPTPNELAAIVHAGAIGGEYLDSLGRTDLAGLIQNAGQVQNESIPGLGDIPILGELFRSNKFQRNETELVIIVTPYLVVPVAGKLPVPTDAVTAPQAGGIGAPALSGSPVPQQSQTGGLAGQAGFGIE